MARVAREMFENIGVDVGQRLDMLIGNAAADLTTYYDDTILRVNLPGLEGEGLKEIAEDARIEDRNRFEALVPRIYELGGDLPASMVDFHNRAACPPAALPANPADTKTCNMTAGKDHRTGRGWPAGLIPRSTERKCWIASRASGLVHHLDCY